MRLMPSEPPEGRPTRGEPAPVYEVRLTRAVVKDLKRLRAHADAIAKVVDQLRTNPAAGHPLRSSLAGVRSLEFTPQESGAGRAAYIVLTEHRVCLVFIIGPHEGFYERAERRAAALELPSEG